MWDFRLLLGIFVVLQLGVQSDNVRFLKSNDIFPFVGQNDNTLVGYTGMLNCPSAVEYIDQLRTAQDELKSNGLDVKVGIANDTSAMPIAKNYGPYSILFAKNREPVRIDFLRNGLELAKFVQKKIQLEPILILNNKAEYDYFVQSSRTVFAAYLTDHDRIETYKKIAYQYNSMFLLTTNQDIARNVLNTTTQKVIVTHNWYNKESTYLDAFSFTRATFQKFVDDELSKTTEMEPQTASLAFSTKSTSIAILFAPSSSENYLSLIQSFADFSSNKDKLDSFYVDTSKRSNKPILEQFGVERSSVYIIYLREFRRLREIPFTKQCTTGDSAPDMVIQKFSNEDGKMLTNYSVHL